MDIAAILALSIPIIAVGGAFVTGIITNLTKHQREMAQLLHGKATQSEVNNEELVALRNQVATLTDKINALTIDRDNSLSTKSELPPEILPERLNS